MGRDSNGDVMGKKERIRVVSLLANKSEKRSRVDKKNGVVGINMKRRQGEKCNGIAQGWTKE